jgi:hypothetical protein
MLEVIEMLCTYSTEKLLGLKGVIVKNVRQLPDKTEIFIELPRKPLVSREVRNFGTPKNELGYV